MSHLPKSPHPHTSNSEMTADSTDPQAIHRLRELCKLSRARVAGMCGLSLEQMADLEEGGHSHFSSVDMKIQAAIKVAIKLSGAQANGMPVVNVFRGAAAQGMGQPLQPFRIERPNFKQRFEETPAFMKLLLIVLVMVFLLVGVAMPLLYALPNTNQPTSSSR